MRRRTQGTPAPDRKTGPELVDWSGSDQFPASSKSIDSVKNVRDISGSRNRLQDGAFATWHHLVHASVFDCILNAHPSRPVDFVRDPDEFIEFGDRPPEDDSDCVLAVLFRLGREIEEKSIGLSAVPAPTEEDVLRLHFGGAPFAGRGWAELAAQLDRPYEFWPLA